MPDLVLIDGDQAVFMPSFGAAIVMVQPGKLAGSGPATIGGKAVCVDGDEGKLSVPGCAYITGQCPIPGMGTLKIQALAGNQKAAHTRSGGKPVLLKGGNFIAKFEVQTPAQQPTPAGPVPDAVPQHVGQGQFITTNLRVKGT
jgi:hypothetical protein